MAVRDRIVAAVLAAGVLVGMALWQAVTPWLGIAVVLAAVVGACAVYRVDGRRRVSGRAPVDEPDVTGSSPEVVGMRDEVSRPRRAAGRP